MNAWETRADDFHFRHRTKNNNDKVNFITSHVFKMIKPLELDDEASYLKLGPSWRLKQDNQDLVFQYLSNDIWITKMSFSPS